VDEFAEIPAFYSTQVARCADLGMDVTGYPVSHVAVRTRTWLDYARLRGQMERLSTANLENVWNGRPISKLMLREPVPVAPGAGVPLIELIPPFHQRVYRMGLEHIGFVVGDDVDDFSRRHRNVLTGQQFQSPICEPYYVLFPDYTHVKFYRWSLAEVCKREGNAIDGFRHATDWQPVDELAGPYELT
jgi:predicted metalloenzyme YecM